MRESSDWFPPSKRKEQFDIEELNTLLDKIYAVDQDIKALTKENSILQSQYNLLTNITAPNTPFKSHPLSLAIGRAIWIF